MIPKILFARMVLTGKLNVLGVTVKLAEIEEKVDYEMKHNVRVEVKDENGKWIEWKNPS